MAVLGPSFVYRLHCCALQLFGLPLLTFSSRIQGWRTPHIIRHRTMKRSRQRTLTCSQSSNTCVTQSHQKNEMLQHCFFTHHTLSNHCVCRHTLTIHCHAVSAHGYIWWALATLHPPCASQSQDARSLSASFLSLSSHIFITGAPHTLSHSRVINHKFFDTFLNSQDPRTSN